jgi:hypothetical protein
MTKIAGSGSGSISQRHGSADPDQHQNAMNPEHCYGAFGSHRLTARPFSDPCIACVGAFHELFVSKKITLSFHSCTHDSRKKIIQWHATSITTAITGDRPLSAGAWKGADARAVAERARTRVQAPGRPWR